MPRTTIDTSTANFDFKDDFCGGSKITTYKTLQNYYYKSGLICYSFAADTRFRGVRYWYKGDPATVLLFDKAGYIAGIQTLVNLIHMPILIPI